MIKKYVFILFLINQFVAYCQVDKAIFDGVDLTYIDAVDGKIKSKPTNFYVIDIEGNRSTKELSFTEKYFITSDSMPHINEEIRIYSVERKKSKTYYTDSTGKIEVILPYGMWKCYAIKMGHKKELGMIATSYSEKKTKLDGRTIDIYDWDAFFQFNILFEVGKSNIKEESYSTLNEISAYLNRMPDQKIEVIGHTDNSGSPSQNLQLSAQRAEAVKKYLIQQEVNKQRILTKGVGDTRPIADNTSEKGRQKNRRTEIRLF